MSHRVAAEAAVRGLGLLPEALEPIGAGASNEVYRVTCSDGSVVVARAGTERAARYEMEDLVSERARRAGVPAPSVLGIETYDGVDVMVASCVPGLRLSDAVRTMSQSKRRQVAFEVGWVLGRIHMVEVEGFGNLGPSGAGPASTFDEWFIDDLPACSGVGDVVAEFEAHRSLLRECSAGLAHGDFSPTNILVADGRVSGVVDWESAKGGPPELDFGWWDWWTARFPTPLSFGDLISGYTTVRPLGDDVDRLRRLVVLRIKVGHLAWALARGDPEAINAARESLRS